MTMFRVTKLFVCLGSLFLVQCLDPPKEDKDKSSAKLPPCGACTNLVTSFEAGLARTKRGKLEGGDAAWEEKSGQRYATSEVRLAEITEQLCKDVGRGQVQCHVNQGDWEEDIETWWTLEPETRWDRQCFIFRKREPDVVPF